MKSASVALALLAMLWASACIAGVDYIYDELGRIAQAINSDGTITTYAYDANGNILAINRVASTTLTIATFSPSIAHVGSQITIDGSGFSTTPSQNAVAIGGAAAVVTSASVSELTVTVPADALTGPIAVTVGAATAVSSQTLTVLRPTITSFSPTLVAPGGLVTLLGTNLNLVPGSTSFTSGGVPTILNSLTNTKAVFAAPTSGGGTGLIQALTSYGQATSTSRLIVVPPAVGASNVAASATLPAAGSAVTLNVNQAGKYGIFAFDAVTDQFVSLQLSALSTSPQSAYVSYTVYSPANAVIDSGSLTSSAGSIHLPRIVTSGTYVLALVPSSSSSTLQVTAALDLNAELSTSGTTTPVSIPVAGQSRRYIFSGVAGQTLGFGFMNLAFTPSSVNAVNVTVKKPDGSSLSSFSCLAWYTGCGSSLRNLPATGTYTILMVPGSAATMTLNATITQAVSGTLTTDTPLPLNLALPGQNALLSFMAGAGQTVALGLTSIATSPASKNVNVTVYNSGGTQIASSAGTATSQTLNLTNLAAGAYTVFIVPVDGATATMQVTLASALAGTLPVDGTSSTYSNTLPGQNGYFTFSGTAGQNIGFALTNMVVNPIGALAVTVNKPDGSSLTSFNCLSWYTGCGASFRNLPATGTYAVTIAPGAQSTMSFRVTLSQSLTGTLALNTPFSLNLAAPGQFALLNFTTTAGQTVALGLTSIATSPASKNVNVTVYNSGGTQIASSASTGTSQTLNLTNLAAGTYTVLIAPVDGSTATMQVTLASALSGTFPVDGTSSTYSNTLPGQNGYFTFAATAGQSLGFALTGMTANPLVALIVTVSKPDGSSLTSFNCLSWYTGCGASLRNLPATGTYAVTIAPNGQATMSFNATLSVDVTGTVTSGTPFALNLDVPGRNALLNFTIAASQTVVLSMSSVATAPASKNVNVYVYNGSGTLVGSGISSAASWALTLSSLAAGTYTVLIAPADGATATLQVGF